MKKVYLSILVLLISFFFSNISFGQNKTQWVTWLNDTSINQKSLYSGKSFILDNEDNIYVLSLKNFTNQTFANDSSRYHISKISDEGTLLWEIPFIGFSNNNILTNNYPNDYRLFVNNEYLFLVTNFFKNNFCYITLSKYDFNGNLISQHIESDSTFKRIEDIQILNDGSIFLSIFCKKNSETFIVLGYDNNFNKIYSNEIINNNINIEYLENNSPTLKLAVNDTSVNICLGLVCLNNSKIYFERTLMQYNRINNNLNWKQSENDTILDYSLNITLYNNSLKLNGSNKYELYSLINGNFIKKVIFPYHSLKDKYFSNDGKVYGIEYCNLYDKYKVNINDTNGNSIIILEPSIPYLFKSHNDFIVEDSSVYICGSVTNDNPFISSIYKNYSAISQISKNGAILYLDYLKVNSGSITPQKMLTNSKGNLLVLNSFYSEKDSQFNNGICIQKICTSCESLIKGDVFLDNNSNCLRDTNEFIVENNLVHIMPQDNYTYTDSLGKYSFLASSGNCTIEIIPNYSFSICDSSYFVNVDSISLDSLNFAYNSTILIDGKTNINGSAARPGFTQSIFIRGKNIGTTSLSNSIFKLKVDTMFTFNNSIPAPDSISSDEIFWTIHSLNAGMEKYFYVTLNVNSNSSIGTPYNLISSFNVIGDQNLPNNIDTFSGILVGSYDPNAKNANPIGNGDEHLIETNTVLDYTIQFQNTGTDTAFNIKVFDVLDNNLDISTLKINGSSHPMNYKLENRMLKFYFNNILLPDSNRNKDLSNGFVSYSIKPKSSVKNALIKNTADIYFDFNIPITTNTTFHTIKESIAPVKVEFNTFSLYPNPTSNNETNVHITVVNEDYFSIAIFDFMGRKVEQINEQFLEKGIHNLKLKTTRYSQGIYFVVLNSKKSKKQTKKLSVIN